MCLNTVSRNVEKGVEILEKPMVGYKLFYPEPGGQLSGPYHGSGYRIGRVINDEYEGVRKEDELLLASNVDRETGAMHVKYYRKGFHIFESREDAVRFRFTMGCDLAEIHRVEFNHIVAVGEQTVDVIDMNSENEVESEVQFKTGKVWVARQMVIKEKVQE